MGIALWKKLYFNIGMETKRERKKLIEIAIAIQSISGASPSDCFITESQKYIDGKITLDELTNIIYAHYDMKDVNKN